MTVDYTTLDGSAIAGTDYTAASGTATIPAGRTSTTVAIDTLSGSSGGVSFFLRLSNAQGASISDHFAEATITGGACSAVFPSAVQNTDPGGRITFRFDTRVSDPDNTLETARLIDNSGNANNSCGAVDCSATTPVAVAADLPAFENSTGTANVSTGFSDPDFALGEDGRSDYGTVAIGFRDQLTDTGAFDTYRIERLTFNSGSEWVLRGGTDYYIGELDPGFDMDIRVSGDGTARLFVRDGPLRVGNSVEVNAGGNPGRLLVAGYSGVELATGSPGVINALVYSRGDVSLGNEQVVNGAVAATGAITLGSSNARVNYDGGAVDGLNDRGLCPDTTAGPDHYAISHAGNGLSCVATPITISAEDAGGSAVDAGTATLRLSTSSGRGSWSAIRSGGGILADSTPGDGQAEYTFPGGEQSVTLAFDYPSLTGNPEVVNIDVTDGVNGEEATSDPDLTISRAGFIVINDSSATAFDQRLPVQIAGKWSDEGHAPTRWGLQAVEAAREDTEACVPAFPPDTEVTVQLAAECDDPATCGGRAVRLRNGGATTAITTNDDNGGAGTSAYSPVTLRFDPDGDGDATAPLAVRYADAGRLRLHARWPIPRDDGTPSGEYLTGASTPFIVRPFGFDVDFADDRADNGTAGVSYAADADGSPFIRAGADVDTTVTAVVWQSGDDGDGDGVPDAGAGLGDNAATPNFGNEAAAEPVDLVRRLVEPAGGAPGTLTVDGDSTGGGDLAGFSGGTTTVPVSWNEVGIIDLAADLDDGAYLTSAAGSEPVSGRVANVGRFYPDRFTTDTTTPGNGVFANACTAAGAGFTYTGQPFGYGTMRPAFIAEARAVGGTVTANYRDDFNILARFGIREFGLPVSGTDTVTLPGGGTADVDWTRAPAPVALTDNRDGTTTVTLGDDRYRYLKTAASEVAPYAPSIELTIDDYADRDNIRPGDVPEDLVIDAAGTELRYGRLWLGNAHQSERYAMTIPVEARYFDGVDYRLNTRDSCTAYDAASFLALEDRAGTLVADGDTAATGSGTLAGGRPPAGAAVQLTAPGAGNTGRVGLMYCLAGTDRLAPCAGAPAAGLPWLRADWPGDGNQDGTPNDDPSGLGTFGVYEGRDGQIFRREVY